MQILFSYMHCASPASPNCFIASCNQVDVCPSPDPIAAFHTSIRKETCSEVSHKPLVKGARLKLQPCLTQKPQRQQQCRLPHTVLLISLL